MRDVVLILLRHTALLAAATASAANGTTDAAASSPPPRIFHWVGMYSANSGNSDPDNFTLADYNPVPFLWRYDPTVDGVPSARARFTYEWQQRGATAAPPSAWRAFLVYQDAATVIGGNPADANDIANTLQWLQRQGYPLDYVFADLEGYYPDGDWRNTYALINQVRGTPIGARTRIGNFGWWPGPVNLSADYPKYADHRTVAQQYVMPASNGLAGLTVAMPVAYAMQAYELHADDASWGASWWSSAALPSALIGSLTYNQRAAIGRSYLSPNQRAGMFYAPLEQVSLAKRSLPAGHQLIPWVSAFQSSTQVPALQPGMVPTLEDNEVLLEHLRLRGIDGYYAFGFDQVPVNEGTYADGSELMAPAFRTYVAAMAKTWHAMDWFFALPTEVGAVSADRPLNLLTFKNTGGTYADPGGHSGGIEWSAYQRGNRVLAVVSNLGNGAQAANGTGTGATGNWGSVFVALGSNLPSQSPLIPPGNHLVLQYLTNPVRLSSSGLHRGSTLGRAQGWHSSGGALRVARASGSGDGRATVVAIQGTSTIAWVANAQTANPGGIGGTANDTMVYTCRLYTGWSGEGSASFGPVVGGGSSLPMSEARRGPTVWVTVAGAHGGWGFGRDLTTGAAYSATNSLPAANTWYQIAMRVNPATNQATIYIRDLTNGGGWVLLQFPGAVTTLPAELAPDTNSPSLYDGFGISGPSGAQFDGIGAELYPYPESPASTFRSVDSERP
ncbi:MAG TPA: hypothetical protein VMT09_04920 [Steroidobacteraceae bacterium]|nr:hypothetical protein [Steroidobacteraceae bacterium]